jgi:hypothetical protein
VSTRISRKQRGRERLHLWRSGNRLLCPAPVTAFAETGIYRRQSGVSKTKVSATPGVARHGAAPGRGPRHRPVARPRLSRRDAVPAGPCPRGGRPPPRRPALGPASAATGWSPAGTDQHRALRPRLTRASAAVAATAHRPSPAHGAAAGTSSGRPRPATRPRGAGRDRPATPRPVRWASRGRPAAGRRHVARLRRAAGVRAARFPERLSLV